MLAKSKLELYSRRAFVKRYHLPPLWDAWNSYSLWRKHFFSWNQLNFRARNYSDRVRREKPTVSLIRILLYTVVVTIELHICIFCPFYYCYVPPFYRFVRQRKVVCWWIRQPKSWNLPAVPRGLLSRRVWCDWMQTVPGRANNSYERFNQFDRLWKYVFSSEYFLWIELISFFEKLHGSETTERKLNDSLEVG